MRLTRASQYAVAALAHMARQPDDIVASHNVARIEQMPERFLLKVLKPLVSASILHAVRGPGGGYRLARPARDITLLEVVEAVEGPIRGGPDAPSTGANDHLDRRLREIFGGVANDVRRQLSRVRIADLAKKR